jgi:hypothetical protein
MSPFGTDSARLAIWFVSAVSPPTDSAVIKAKMRTLSKQTCELFGHGLQNKSKASDHQTKKIPVVGEAEGEAEGQGQGQGPLLPLQAHPSPCFQHQGGTAGVSGATAGHACQGALGL